uniref:Reverse transcriptase Ty1/copia-type domain-containing protein n=1 Tax=Solanum lycopersicum TaxID=4081 RepID=A0A3Q7GR18_SOLLC
MIDYDLDVTTDTEVHHVNYDNAKNTNDNVDTGVLHDDSGVANIDHDDSTINVPIATKIVEVPTTSVRRTSRSVKQPVWIKDYTKGKQSSTRHPIANSLSYDRVTSCYKAFSNLRLTSVEYDLTNGHIGDVVLQDITGSKGWPDISYAVQILSQFMQSPKRSHWDATITVIKYLKGIVGRGIWLQSKPANELSCWCDSDWKQQTVSRSSAETEYRSMKSVVSEVTGCWGCLLS